MTVGRASNSSIVVPEEQCSRFHAEFSFENGKWIVRDLQSRNGTRVDDKVIATQHELNAGELVQIASCAMTFVHRLADAFETNSRWKVQDDGQAKNNQATEELSAAESIIERRHHSGLLGDVPIATKTPSMSAETMYRLFRLAFDLGNQEQLEKAAEVALDALLKELRIQAGGILVLQDWNADAQLDPIPSRLNLLAAHEVAGKSYRRISDFLAATVLKEKQGVLARNIQGDQQLALAQISETRTATSVIATPISTSDSLIGILHLYTTEQEPMLTPVHLQITLAVSETLALVISKLSQQKNLEANLQKARKKAEDLQEQLAQQTLLVGKSESLGQVREAIARAAPTTATVLIRGESGVGKELVAQLLHQSSPRRDGPFVCVNCAALSPTLLESELFGHEKGAFTGANERKIGRFEAAHNGTLMLDEIGEMSPEVQAKFLRVLENRTIERLGSHKPIPVDVRIVAATNRDLEEAVNDRLFRSDLYFRLRVIEMRVPPLRARRDDVPLLAEHFLKRFAREIGRRVEGIRPEAVELLKRYDWPGNIRELKNVMERAVVLGSSNWIEPEELVLDALRIADTEHETATTTYHARSLDDMERDHILSTLRATQGNKSRSASILGIERSTLDRKLQRYGLNTEDWKS